MHRHIETACISVDQLRIVNTRFRHQNASRSTITRLWIQQQNNCRGGH